MTGNGPCQRVGCCRESSVHRKFLGGNTILGFCEDHDPLDDPSAVPLFSPGEYRPTENKPPRRVIDG